MHRLMRGSAAPTLVALVAFLAACGPDAPTAQRPATAEPLDRAVLADRDGAERNRIAVLDDCDPTDPAWAPTGGCLRRRGTVTSAEFGALLASPLSLSAVGHPAWRNEPSFLTARAGKSVDVVNLGGRGHTFTRVAAFGGGRVPPLNQGLTPAPECLLAPGTTDPSTLPAGARLDLDDLAPGLHRFQCCIHPWMRAAIRVEAGHGEH